MVQVYVIYSYRVHLPSLSKHSLFMILFVDGAGLCWVGIFPAAGFIELLQAVYLAVLYQKPLFSPLIQSTLLRFPATLLCLLDVVHCCTRLMWSRWRVRQKLCIVRLLLFKFSNQGHLYYAFLQASWAWACLSVFILYLYKKSKIIVFHKKLGI